MFKDLSKDYLGDGVYAYSSDGYIVLTTENGLSEDNKIFLEPNVVEALERFIARAKEA